MVGFDTDTCRPRPVIRFALLVCVAFTATLFVFVVMSYCGHVWLPLDVFSHLRVHLVGGLLGFLFASLSLITVRKIKIAAAILFIAATGTVLYAGFWPTLAQGWQLQLQAGRYEKPFTLISYNVWARNETPEKVVEYINGEDADIVVLTEFTKPYRKFLGQMKKRYPHQYYCGVRAGCHIAILSRIPFEATGAKSPRGGPNLAWVRFGKELGSLSLFGVHLTRPFDSERQWSQMSSIPAETSTAKGPFVVAGDFNATKSSFLVNKFQELSGVMRITSLPTWPTWFIGLPQLGIDHIFVSKGIRALSYPVVGSNAGSDHLPIKVRLAVKNVPNTKGR